MYYANPVYYNQDGEKISRDEHAANPETVLAYNEVNGIGVETRFYGVDWDHKQTPYLFHTSIVAPDARNDEEREIRYTDSWNKAGALSAHAEAVSRLERGVSVFNDPELDAEIARRTTAIVPAAVQAEVRKGQAMDQGPPRDEAVPYKREIIGEYVLQSPAVKKGRDGVDYTIPAGPQAIVGAVSLDGYKLHDAAIVYDPKKVSQETGKSIFLHEPLHVPQLAEAQKRGLVQIHEPHEHKVAEAIARVQATERKQAVGVGMKR